MLDYLNRTEDLNPICKVIIWNQLINKIKDKLYYKYIACNMQLHKRSPAKKQP